MSKKGDGQPPLAISQLGKAINDIEIGDLVDGTDCDSDGDDAEFGPDFVDEGVRNMSDDDSGGDSDEEVEADDYDSDDELPLKERFGGLPSVHTDMLSALGYS